MADAQTIDQLAIEITSSVKGEKKLRNFANALNDLAYVSSGINTSKLQSVAVDIRAITKSFEGFSANNVKNFANSLGRLSQIDPGKLGGFDSLSKSIMNLTTATSGIDLSGITRLTNSLARLSKSDMKGFDGSALQKIANTVTGLVGSLANSEQVDANITRLVGSIAKLADSGNHIGNVTTELPKIGSSLTKLIKDLQGVGTINEGIIKLVDGIARLTNAGKKAAEVTNSLDKFGDAVIRLVKKLQGVGDINVNLANTIQGLGNMAQGGLKFGSVMQQTATHTSNLGEHLKSLGSIVWRTISPFNSFSEKLGHAKKQSKGLASTIGLLYAKYWLLKRGIMAAGKMTGSAQDYIEAFNYFNVALNRVGEDSKDQYKRFGYDNATEYAQSFQDRFTKLQKTMTGYDVNSRTGDLNYTGERNLGLNIKDVMQYQAQVAQISNSVGQLGEVSIMASKAMSMIAADLSSLTNTDLVQVQENLVSGFNGMTRAVYKYGINITQANLQQIAYNHGVNTSVAKLSMAAKQQLRLIGILEQSKVAWGDLNRTLNQPANMLRRLQAGFANLARTIGSLFVPLLNVVYPVLNAIVSVLQQFFEWIAKLLGVKMPDMSSAFKMPDNMGEAADDSGKVADNTGKAAKNAKKLNDNIQGFDEINKLQADNDNSGNGGGGGGAGGLGDVDLSKDIANLLSQLEKEWGKNFEDKVAKIAERIKKALLDGWNKGGDFTDLGKKFGKWITDGLEKIPWKKIQKTIRKIVKSFATFINGAFKGADWNVIGNTIAQAFNTIVDALYTWWDTIDWLDLGKRLATGVNSVVRNFKWKKFGAMLGAKLRGMIQFAFGFITTIDFKALGKKITESITSFFERMNKVDPRTGLSGWAELGKTISKTFEGILDTIITVLDGLDWDQVGVAIADFLGSIDWGTLMLKVGEVIVKGIGAAIKAGIAAFAKDPLGMAEALVSVLGIIFAYKKLLGFFDIFSVTFGRGMNGAILRALRGNAIGDGISGAMGGASGSGGLLGKIFNPIRNAGSGIASAFSDAFHDNKIAQTLAFSGKSSAGIFASSFGKGLKAAFTTPAISKGLGAAILTGSAIAFGKMGGSIIGERIDANTERQEQAVKTGRAKGESRLAIAKSQGKNVNDTYKTELEKDLANKKKALEDYKNKYQTMIKNGAYHLTQSVVPGTGASGIGSAVASIFQWNNDYSDLEDAEAKIKELEGTIQGMQNTLAKYNGTQERSKQLEDSRSKALSKLREMAKKGKISWYDYAKAQKAVKDSTGSTNDIMGKALITTDKYRSISNQLASDMTKAKVPMEQQKAIMKKLRDAVAEGRLSLKKYQEIVKNSKGDVTKLNKEIAKIPKTKTTKHTVTSNIASIKKEIKGITKKIKTEIELSITVVNKGSTKGQIVSQGKLGHLINDQELNYARQNKQLKMNKDGSIVIQKGSQYATSTWLKKFKAAKIKYTIKKFASGGYLEDGLFTMNRGEIAGRFDNGKSVVANNQQISDGFAKAITATLAPAIKSAVKQGVTEASGNGSQDINVYLDGKQLAENSVKYIRQMNRSNGRTQFA